MSIAQEAVRRSAASNGIGTDSNGEREEMRESEKALQQAVHEGKLKPSGSVKLDPSSLPKPGKHRRNSYDVVRV